MIRFPFLQNRMNRLFTRGKGIVYPYETAHLSMEGSVCSDAILWITKIDSLRFERMDGIRRDSRSLVANFIPRSHTLTLYIENE